MHPTAIAAHSMYFADNGTANEQPKSLRKELKQLFFASSLEPALIRRSRTLTLVAVLAFFLDVSRFTTSMFQAQNVFKYLRGALELLLGGSLLFIALYGALHKDVRHAGMYALGACLTSIYAASQIAFGVFAVQTLEEELSRVDETQTNPQELQFQVALCILTVLLDAAGCVAYCCSCVAGLLLRQQILKPIPSRAASVNKEREDMQQREV